ncbi:MAG: hypothetical protein HY791_24740 [Deltaproteobacteria bacterium]|nr:hypothetical protein [Deltaproteobacteria bacterium]
MRKLDGSRRLGALCAIAAGACSEPTWRVEGDAVVLVAVADGRVTDIAVGRALERVPFDALGTVVAFPLESSDFIRPDGQPFDFSALGAASSKTPPADSCRRCRAGSSGPPLVFGAGDFCPIPEWVKPAGLGRNGTTSDATDAPEVQVARELVGLSARGPCDVPLETDSRRHEVLACPAAPPDAPLVFQQISISATGTFVGVARDAIRVMGAEGTYELAVPAGECDQLTPVPGGDFIIPIAISDNLTHFYRLRVAERILERLPLTMPRGSAGLTLPSGEVLLLGRITGPGGYVCRGAELHCDAIMMPSPGDPECDFLASRSIFEEIVGLDDQWLLSNHFPAGFVYWAPDRQATCQKPRVEGRPEINQFGPFVRLGDTLLAAGHADEAPVPELFLRADIVDGRVGPFSYVGETRERIIDLVAFEGHGLFIGSSEVFEVTANGEVLGARRRDAPELLPGLEHGLGRIETSTTGWQIAEDTARRIYSRRERDPFALVYGSAIEGIDRMLAVARVEDRCLGATQGRLWTFDREDGDGCGALSVLVEPMPAFDGTVLDGFEWSDGMALVSDIGGDEWALDLSSEGSTRRIARSSGRASYLEALALTPTSVLVAFSGGRLMRVFLDGTTTEVKLPSRIESLGGGTGVAWAGGVDALYRITITDTGLAIGDKSPELTALPSDVDVTRTIRSIYAPLPDRAWLQVTEKSVRASGLETFDKLLELQPGSNGPILVPSLDQGPLAAFKGPSLHFAGVGGRMTAAAGSRLIRGPETLQQTLEALELADCGSFMVVGGVSLHATVILDVD